MKVLQHTRNKRNLFFKPDRADRNYRDRRLGVQLSAVQFQNIEIKHQRDRATIEFQLGPRKNWSEITNSRDHS